METDEDEDHLLFDGEEQYKPVPEMAEEVEEDMADEQPMEIEEDCEIKFEVEEEEEEGEEDFERFLEEQWKKGERKILHVKLAEIFSHRRKGNKIGTRLCGGRANG